MDLGQIRHRHRLGAFLQEHGVRGTMCEVGCAYGGFAEMNLRDWQGCDKYIMVDPWITQPKSVYKERTEGIDYEGYYQSCLRLSQRDPRVLLKRMYSKDAAEIVPDNSLDIVYLDGNHAKEFISEDLRLWWPKVKSGGIFSGHDFYTALTDGYWNEVDGPVKEFVFGHNLPLTLTPCSSWWTIKP